LELDDPHLAPDSGLVEARELLRADAELFVGLTKGSLTVAQPFLCAASRRDVTGDLSGADDGPVCVPYGRDRDSDVDRSSVLVQALSLELIDVSAGPHSLDNAALLLEPVRRNDDVDRSADRLLGSPSEEALRSRVPRENLSIEVLADDRIVRGLYDRRKMSERVLEMRRRRSNAGGQVSLEHGIQLGLPTVAREPATAAASCTHSWRRPLRACENTSPGLARIFPIDARVCPLTTKPWMRPASSLISPRGRHPLLRGSALALCGGVSSKYSRPAHGQQEASISSPYSCGIGRNTL